MADFVELKEAPVVHGVDGCELSRGQMDAIIQTAMDAIIITDEQQRILIFNAAAGRLFGCGAEEAVGSSLGRFIPQRFREGHREQVRFFGATGGTSRKMGRLGEVWGVRSDGREIPLEISVSQVESEGLRLFTAILREASCRSTAAG